MDTIGGLLIGVKMMENEKYEMKYGEVPKDYIKRFVKLLRDKKVKEGEIKKIKDRVKTVLNMPTEQISFIIYMTPQATPRPRLGRFGTFYVKGAMDNSKIFKDFMLKQFPEVNHITTPCKFTLDLYMPIPSGLNRIDQILAELKIIKVISRPDWDNLGKTYSDMIQKHLLQEDSLIYDARVRKFYSVKPRVELKIEYDTHYDCNYSKKTIEGWNTYNEDKSKNRDVL